MAFHHCSIQQEDGTVVAKDVTVSVEETDHDGVAGWYGTLTVTHLAVLTAGERYKLVLDNGQTGDFTVRRNTFAGGQDRAVAIQGVGPLR